MEVPNDIKEHIRKSQNELKNAIRIHQVWMKRLKDDDSNVHVKTKLKEAEKEILTIGQNQKRVVDRLRRELLLYQQHLKERNRLINPEYDNKYIAQQLREHQARFRDSRIKILKPSVLNNIHNHLDNNKVNNDFSDSECDVRPVEKEDSNSSGNEQKDPCDLNSPAENGSTFSNGHIKPTDNLMESARVHNNENNWEESRESVEDMMVIDEDGNISPSPSPLNLPEEGSVITQEMFLRLLGLATHRQKELMIKKMQENRKRRLARAHNMNFENFDMMAKRKKNSQFPYLQSHNAPPQTRSAKLRKEQKQGDKSSREGSPSASAENKWWKMGCKPEWQMSIPAGLSVIPVYPEAKKVCHSCGRRDVPSLLVWCLSCHVIQHTGCGDGGRCSNCGEMLPDPATCAVGTTNVYRDKLVLKKELQEKNVQLRLEVQKLLDRSDVLKENLDENQEEKRRLLSQQIKTQQDLQKLLNFINIFRDTSLSANSTSVSDTCSELSKSNDE